jgi:hypothetical protein
MVRFGDSISGACFSLYSLAKVISLIRCLDLPGFTGGSEQHQDPWKELKGNPDSRRRVDYPGEHKTIIEQPLFKTGAVSN